MSNYIAIRIDAQYLDSYLYSGALFLASPDGVISVYDWEVVVRETLAAYGSDQFSSYFLDYRKLAVGPALDGEVEFEVTPEILEGARTDSLQWGVWPTDLTIYSNVLYLSDEVGVHRIPFNYLEKKLQKDETRRIKDGYVYSLAAGDGGRVAAASSNDGLSLILTSKYKVESRTIIEDEVLDCDWFGTNLVANSDSQAYLAEFPVLPRRDDYVDGRGFFVDLKETLQRAPRQSRVGEGKVSTYAWLAGTDLCAVSPTGTAVSMPERRLIKARSASFGSVLEYDSGVEVLRAEVSTDVGVPRPVFWRVFSRSKSYLNHLHICGRSGLQIRSYDTTETEDRYSVELKDLDIH